MPSNCVIKRLGGCIGLVLVALAPPGAAQSEDRPAGQGGDRIVLLGTQGGPIVNPSRSQPANLLVIDGKNYLIDAGDGVTRQLSAAGVAPEQVRTIFITHHHVDHNAGLAPLIAFSWITSGFTGQILKPVEILGPLGTQAILKASLDFLSVSERTFGQIGKLPASSTMFVARDIDKDGVVFDDGSVRVTAAENTHYRRPSIAMNGQLDRSVSYRFDTASGSIVFTGDTGESPALVKLARGADILVAEIDMLFVEPALPEAVAIPTKPEMREQMQFHHSQQHLLPEAVGQLATKAGVGTLVLTHLVPGAKSSDASRYRTEVAKYFSGRIIVGEDLTSVPLLKSEHNKQGARTKRAGPN